MGDQQVGIEKFKQLNGHLYLIHGNHDTRTKIELYWSHHGVIENQHYADMVKYGKYNFYISHYPALCSNFNADRPLKERVISLCGHSHVQDPFADFDKGLIYHVELDAHGCKPVSAEQIIQDIKERIDNEKANISLC